MPNDHVRELIAQLHPDVSVRQLTLAAGLEEGYLAYHLKRDVEQIPKTPVLKEFARAIGCDLRLVFEAWATDAGLPGQTQDPDERELLNRFRGLRPSDQQTLMRVAQSLAGGPPT